jgi:hypothetical protein
MIYMKLTSNINNIPKDSNIRLNKSEGPTSSSKVHISLNQFLKEHKTKGDNKTHVCMPGKFIGKYSIPENKLPLFYDLYLKESSTTQVNTLTFTELHLSDKSPILIDLDLQYDNKDTRITSVHINEIITEILKCITPCFDGARLDYYVLQRPKTYKCNGVYKDGLHIYFPHIITNYEFQYVLRFNLMDKIEEIIYDLNNLKPIGKVYDLDVIEKVGICMYKSTKILNDVVIPGCTLSCKRLVVPAYEVVKCSKDKTDLELLHLLSIRNDVPLTVMNDDIKGKVSDTYDTIKNNRNYVKHSQTINDHNEPSIESNINVNKIIEGLNLLPNKYYDDYHLWRDIGWALANGEQTNEMFQLYDDFSKKSNKYDYNGANKIFWSYNSSHSNGITIASLWYYIKKEAPDEYIELNEKYKPTIEEPVNLINMQDAYNLHNFITDWVGETICSDYALIDDLKKVIGIKIGAQTVYIIKNFNSIEISKASGFDSALRKMLIYKVEEKLINNEIVIKTKNTNVCNLLTKHLKEFVYKDIIFRPNNNIQGIFNLFPGFRAHVKDTCDMSNINLILQHLKEVWANNIDELYDYIIKWLACIIQKDHKNGTALVFISKQGAGKNIIGNFLCDQIFGKQIATTVNDIDKVTQKFNNTIANKVLTILDEVSSISQGYHTVFDKLKSMITEKTQYIEKKGIDPIQIDDYNNYIFFSNHKYPVRIESNDRRYFVSELSNKYMNNYEYFDKLGNQIKSGADDFITYLKLLDISNFNPRKIPDSIIKTEQKMNSLINSYRFLIDMLYEINNGYITTQELFDMYRNWCYDCGEKNIKSKKIFVDDIGVLSEIIRKKNIRGFNINKANIKARMMIDFNVPNYYF